MALREETLRADEASLAKSRFLANMSHELRTPFNAMLGFAQLLKLEGALDDAQLKHVQRIMSSGNQLLELVNQVLDLAKIEAHRVELATREIDLPSLLRECIEQSQSLAQVAGVHVSLASRVSLPPLLGDPGRVRQVVLNLLSNAIKYNTPNGVVELSCERDENWCRLTVRDTGRGIPNERLVEIFDPFFRLPRDAAGDIEGSGIGLALVKQLVSLMKGRIEVESAVGIGSRFSVLWPLVPEVAAVESEPLSVNKAVSASAKLNSPESFCTVLYIEDNVQNRELMSTVFAGLPRIKLITAESPSLGIVLARERQPKLILLDINMPELNGYQVLEVLRSDPSLLKVPVIAVTANALPQQVNEGMAAGFDAYLTKPVDISRLLSLTKDYLKEPCLS